MDLQRLGIDGPLPFARCVEFEVNGERLLCVLGEDFLTSWNFWKEKDEGHFDHVNRKKELTIKRKIERTTMYSDWPIRSVFLPRKRVSEKGVLTASPSPPPTHIRTCDDIGRQIEDELSCTSRDRNSQKSIPRRLNCFFWSSVDGDGPPNDPTRNSNVVLECGRSGDGRGQCIAERVDGIDMDRNEVTFLSSQVRNNFFFWKTRWWLTWCESTRDRIRSKIQMDEWFPVWRCQESIRDEFWPSLREIDGATSIQKEKKAGFQACDWITKKISYG